MAQVSFGIKGGLNSSSLKNYEKLFAIKDMPPDIQACMENEQRVGFNLGIFLQLEVPYTNFFFQPELLFSNQGSKAKEEYRTALNGIDFTHKSSHQITLNYLQLPVYLGYKLRLGASSILVGAGAYYAYGLWDSKYISENKEFKRSDAGVGLMAGLEIRKFQIKADYDYSLLTSSSLRNRTFKVAFGYIF